MKEIIELDQKLTAWHGGQRPEATIDISRDEMADAVAALPDDLRAGITSLQRALNEVVPEPFDYFVFLGGDEEASFSINFEQMPAAGSMGGDFDPARSIVEQVRELDWDEQRRLASEQHDRMDEIVYLLERIARPLPSAKKWQRQFREEIKDFVREKRREAGKIHVLIVDEAEGLLASEYADGDAFRAALPGVIVRGGEVVSVVAGGKPLPVERIDALKAEAQRHARERGPAENADQPADPSALDIEAEVISEPGATPFPLPGQPSHGEQAIP